MPWLSETFLDGIGDGRVVVDLVKKAPLGLGKRKRAELARKTGFVENLLSVRSSGDG